MRKIEITIEKFIRLRNELRGLKIFGKKDKLDLCRKYGVTSDDVILAIKYLGYLRKKEKMSELGGN